MPPQRKSVSRSNHADVTPAKLRTSPYGLDANGQGKAASMPKLPANKDGRNLEVPDSPTPHKRSRSTSDCTAKGKLSFTYEASRFKHAQDCLDPNCRHQLPLVQKAPSKDKRSTVPNQQLNFEIPDDEEGFSFSDESIGRNDDARREPPLPRESDGRSPNEPSASHTASHSEADNDSQEPNIPSPRAQPSSHNPNSAGNASSTNRNSTTDFSNIHDSLLTKLRENLTDGEQKGYIYIMTDEARPNLCKIGRSTNSKARAEKIKADCKICIEPFRSRKVKHCIRTEQLIHIYLSDVLNKHACEECNKEHKEWFVISREEAKAVVQRWVDFMNNQNPYDFKSKLKPFWRLWLDTQGLQDTDVDTDMFRARWDTILLPSWFDYFRVWSNRVHELVESCFWPVFATLGWTVVFVILRHPAAFFFMALSVVGALFDLSNDKQYLNSISVKLT